MNNSDNSSTVLPPATYDYAGGFFDIEKLLRTDSFFFDKVEKAVKRLIKMHEQLKTSASDQNLKLYKEAFFDYLKLTHFSISPLLGYYYPTYPLGTPLSLKDFPFAHIFYNLNIGPTCSTVFRGSRQISKCCRANTMCKFRHKKTGKIIEMPIEKFFAMHSAGNKK